MKTKLLYLTSFLLVFFTSCSVDDNNNEPTVDQKETAVKNLFDTFSKSVIHSSSYSKFVEEMRTKSSSGVTEEELQQLEQEFLSKQSPEFIGLYNYVLALGLSEEELRNIIFQYVGVYGKMYVDELKGENDDCEVAVENGLSSLLTLFSKLVCEIINNSDNDDQDENEN